MVMAMVVIVVITSGSSDSIDSSGNGYRDGGDGGSLWSGAWVKQ